MPAPTHMVTMPYFRLLRRRACTTVAARIAPVAPSGWPRAIAPPIGFTLAGSRPRSPITASACAANASFSSIQSSWSWVMPAALQASGIANFGPMPMISGGTPLTANEENLASGVRLCSRRNFSDTTSSAPAPSDICELLAAVTEPLAANTGFSLASDSTVESARAPSSVSTVRFLMMISPVARSGVRVMISTGVVSSLKKPACCAAMARRCDSTENASCASRDTFHWVATFSAVKPMP